MESLCVPSPIIEEVMLLETGRILTAQEAIGADYGEAEKLRMRLAEENAKDNHSYKCPICRVGVYLCVNRTEQRGKRFYFKHCIEEDNCPAVTRGQLSKEEIEARKYNGVKESPSHIRMKEIIAESLACDPMFSDIEVEPRWKGDGGTWRKPDVRAVLDGTTKVVFEIQLSTTFLHVIAERRLFYQQQGALLCWVFNKFDPADARMTQDDIFYNNNRNLFLASEQTLASSKENQAFTLDCHWHMPVLEGTTVTDQWNSQRVQFSKLCLDYDLRRVYFFDYDLLRDDLEAHSRTEKLKQRFAAWWASQRFPQADSSWVAFRQEFRQYGVNLPEYPASLSGLLNALYSAKAGKAVGWIHPKFISVAHTIAGRCPEVLQYFLAAASVYRRKAQLLAEDSHKPGASVGKWEAKLEKCRLAKREGDTHFDRNKSFDQLVAFIFPEVWEKLDAWDAVEADSVQEA